MRIGIIGRGEILLQCAQKLHDLGHEIPLVITAKEAPEYKVSRADFRLFAGMVGAKYAQTPKIDSQDIYDMLSASQPMDVAVSINYSGVISEKVMSFFKMGILNAHGGDLPRYRGNACQAWALLNAEEKIGLCIHKMIGGELDSGDILAKEFMTVNINTRIGEVYKWIERITPDLMVSAVNSLHENPSFVYEVQSKDPRDALRCYPRNPCDGKIDWSHDAEKVLRLINASSEPYSGAFCDYNGSKLIIWRAMLSPHTENYLAFPGQLVIHTSGDVDVICGNGIIRLLEVELDMKRQFPSSIFKSIRKRLK
jgi:methionyl-tRNA formyltransferase